LSDEGVDDFEDVLLLASRQLRDRFKRLPDFATRSGGPPWLCLAEQLLDGDTTSVVSLYLQPWCQQLLSTVGGLWHSGEFACQRQ